MLEKIEDIKNASHLLIVTDNKSFANASALYTYALTLHKKVSLQTSNEIETKYSFLPWYDKVRKVTTSNADLVINVGENTFDLYGYFRSENVKINTKLATSLYCGLLNEFSNFTSKKCNGTVFAYASELIALNAEHKLCREYMLNKTALSTLRLKAILFKSLHLKKEATLAEVYVCDEDFKSSGSCLQVAVEIMHEVIQLVHVKEVILIKTDENSKIIHKLKDI